jgi:Gluconate 2-dehydrogenase subunit 3
MPDHEKPTNLTRRQWLLRLGETAVLAGFSGVAGEELMVLGAQARAGDNAQALPPGLYGPSPEHMTHALFRDEPYVTPPSGSETEYARPHEGPFKPAFFSTDEFPVVTRLVGLLLNAPGATAPESELKPVRAGTVDEIAEWIDLVVSEAAAVRLAVKNLSAQHHTLAVNYYGADAIRQLETADPQATWREGLAWLNAESLKLSARGFIILTEAQQLELLTTLSKASSDKNVASTGTHLFRLLKNQTIEGYYTSKAGLKELDFKGNAFYAESPGCPQT